MVTIVVNDSSVTEEQIRAFIKERNIEGEVEVISRKEFEERRAIERENAIPFMLQEPSGPVDITAEIESRERKQKKYIKDQQKLARRYYGRK